MSATDHNTGTARVISREELAASGVFNQQGGAQFSSTHITSQGAAVATTYAQPCVNAYQAQPVANTFQSASYPVANVAAYHSYPAYPAYRSNDPLDAAHDLVTRPISSTIQMGHEYVAQPIGHGMNTMSGVARQMFHSEPQTDQYDAADLTHDYVVRPVGGVVGAGVSALGAGLLMPMGYHVGAGLNYLAKKLTSGGSSYEYSEPLPQSAHYVAPSALYATEARGVPASTYVGAYMPSTMPQARYVQPSMAMSGPASTGQIYQSAPQPVYVQG